MKSFDVEVSTAIADEVVDYLEHNQGLVTVEVATRVRGDRTYITVIDHFGNRPEEMEMLYQAVCVNFGDAG